MRWTKWSMLNPQQGDFFPILIGCAMLLMSLPAVVRLLVNGAGRARPQIPA